MIAIMPLKTTCGSFRETVRRGSLRRDRTARVLDPAPLFVHSDGRQSTPAWSARAGCPGGWLRRDDEIHHHACPRLLRSFFRRVQRRPSFCRPSWGGGTLELPFPPGQAVEHRLPLQISGGVRPYESSIEGCPDWVTLIPDQRILTGTRPIAEAGNTFFCTFRVTESDPGFRPARSVTYGLRLVAAAATTRQLELTRTFEEIPGDELVLRVGRRGQTEFQAASGGVAPYTYELVDCMLPAGLGFQSSTRVLSGTPEAEYRGPNCTYRVTDSSSPPVSVFRSVGLVIEPLEASGGWRFRARTAEPGQGPCVLPGTGAIPIATLPRAHGGSDPDRYEVPGAPHPSESGSLWSFNPQNRVLTFANPVAPPVLATPNTYRYLVGTDNSVDETNADDALCMDVRVDSGANICPGNDSVDPPLEPEHYVHIQLQLRDDAFWHGSEYRCPDTAPSSPRPGESRVSNPVHEALGPVHARRAAAVASSAVQDRVRRWSPGAEQASFAVVPEVGLASLSGQSDSFDYTGTSESATFGAETGAGAWQAGLVASFTLTELRYRADAALSELGYAPASTTPKFCRCIPSPRGTRRPADTSGRPWAREPAACATATTWVSPRGPAPTCACSLTPQAPRSLWPRWCPGSFKPKPASSHSPSTSRELTVFRRRCPR